MRIQALSCLSLIVLGTGLAACSSESSPSPSGTNNASPNAGASNGTSGAPSGGAGSVNGQVTTPGSTAGTSSSGGTGPIATSGGNGSMGGAPSSSAGSASGGASNNGGTPANGGSTSTAGGPSGVPQGYDANLQKILNSTFRNKNEDNSPYVSTPSADLYDKADLYGPVSAYKEGRGSYGGSEWFENEYYPGNGAATFRASCEVSHFAYDDPALFPGQPEASHLVMFLGNTHTNAYSTYDTLLNSGGSTCNGGELNRSAYWVPAMMDGKGNVVVPAKIKFYYKTEAPVGVGKTEVFPPNLKLLADRSNNQDGNLDTATFRCNDVYNGGKSSPSNTLPTCYGPNAKSGLPGALEMLIFFNYCWNGDAGTSGDWWQNHLVNMVRPENNWFSSQCPASHPHLLPAIVTHIFYDVAPGEDTSTWFLATDVNPDTRKVTGQRGATAIAGWIGGWNKQVNQEWIDHCNNTLGAECGAGMLADSDNARALRLRHDWITGPHRIPLKDIYDQMCSASKDKAYDGADGGAMAAYCRPGNAEHNL